MYELLQTQKKIRTFGKGLYLLTSFKPVEKTEDIYHLLRLRKITKILSTLLMVKDLRKPQKVEKYEVEFRV
jgi:hypothetical protein